MISAAMIFAACKKKAYYFDSGTHNAKYEGTILEYIKEKPLYFDTLATVIELAEMEDVFQNENVTFFAPTSSSITKSYRALNEHFRVSGKDTVQMDQIKPIVWRETLSLYILKGSYVSKDFPQLDTMAFLSFPGQGFVSYGGRPMNVGVIYNDAGSIQYAGYRQLFYSFIPDFSTPKDNLIHIPVASSDIQPENGVIHVLNQKKHNFGFETARFIDLVNSYGIAEKKP